LPAVRRAGQHPRLTARRLALSESKDLGRVWLFHARPGGGWPATKRLLEKPGRVRASHPRLTRICQAETARQKAPAASAPR
jgi:hypothetical protein